MATITTDTFLDSGTARTAGETWTINGATLTVRTDTRWHAGSPASMTGSLGAIALSPTLGGNLFIDGTKVRWLQFDTGSGTVPAIGTTITQGGVSGYLLGVWADYTSAPTAVGAAMPSTGYIKFREVTGGAFSAGALTGIGANALSADVTGWIEVVADNGAALTGSVKNTVTMTGDWFYLGTTSGSPGQTFNVPTNGGGSTTHVYGVQIETAPGSDTYEWFYAINSTYFTLSYMNTDIRSKFVESPGNGIIRIGQNGSAVNVGYTPVSGCKVRVPNILLRQCTTAARATNAAPATSFSTRPSLAFSGAFSIDKVSCDWYTSPAYYWSNAVISNSSFESALNITGATTISDTVISPVVAGGGATLTVAPVNGVSLNKVKAARYSGSSVFAPTFASNLSVSDCEIIYVATSAAAQPATFNSCTNVSINNIRTIGCTLWISICSDVVIDGHDFVGTLIGNSTTTNCNIRAVGVYGSTNVVHSNLTFGFNGALSNTQPCASLYYISSSKNVKCRNAGTYSSPLSSGSVSANYPNYLIEIAGGTSPSVDCKFQKLFITATRTAQISYSFAPTDARYVFENLFSSLNQPHSSGGGMPLDTIYRACGSMISVYQGFGNNWFDNIQSSTTGTLFLLANFPTNAANQYITKSISPVTGSGFSINALVMKTAGDYIIFEMPYYAKPYTAFRNVAPSFSATGSYTYQYQIDTGSGWNGTWKTISAANLTSETIGSLGFKLKIKITVVTTNATNSFSNIQIPLATTATSIETNTYPLDTSTLSFTGLIPGSEVRCYTGSDPATAIEIGGIESSGSTFSFIHSSGGTVGFIRIFALGYQPLSIDPYTYSTSDTSLLIQQVVDRNYVNP